MYLGAQFYIHIYIILEKRYTSNGLVYTIKSTNVYKKPLRHANQYSKHTKIAHFDKIDEEDQKTV